MAVALGLNRDSAVLEAVHWIALRPGAERQVRYGAGFCLALLRVDAGLKGVREAVDGRAGRAGRHSQTVTLSDQTSPGNTSDRHPGG